MKKTLSLIFILVSTTNLFAQLTPVKLHNWVHEGLLANGNWTISADSLSVRQSLNDEPTFFVSPDTFSNVTIRGSFFVDGSDDDFIGFVFGYKRPISEEEYFDFYLFDWKRGAQSNAAEGYTLSKVEGFVDVVSGTNRNHPFWDHLDSTQTVIDTYYGDYGWLRNIEYEFELIYESDRIQISIDTTKIFDIEGDFPPGRFGFYNYSQPGVNYREFRLNEAPIANMDYFMSPEDSLLSMDLVQNDTDKDGHQISITQVRAPLNGLVSFSEGDSLVEYLPNENFYGADSFYYHITDGNGSFDSAIVVIEISPMNDAPIRISQIPNITIKENSSNIFLAAVNEYFTDIDENDDFLTNILVSSNGNVNSVVSSDSIFISTTGFVGFDTLVVSAIDDSGAVATDTVAVEVTNVNTPPYVVNMVADTAINKDSPKTFYTRMNWLFADYDENDSPLDSFNLSNNNIVLAELEKDSLFLKGNNLVGIDSVIIFAIDDSNAVASDTFLVEALEVTGIANYEVPMEFNLSQNYPNPFNPRTTIKYELARQSKVELKIFSLDGKEIITLINSQQSAGSYKVTVDSGDLASGMYIYMLKAGNYMNSKKMILIR